MPATVTCSGSWAFMDAQPDVAIRSVSAARVRSVRMAATIRQREVWFCGTKGSVPTNWRSNAIDKVWPIHENCSHLRVLSLLSHCVHVHEFPTYPRAVDHYEKAGAACDEGR